MDHLHNVVVAPILAMILGAAIVAGCAQDAPQTGAPVEDEFFVPPPIEEPTRPSIGFPPAHPASGLAEPEPDDPEGKFGPTPEIDSLTPAVGHADGGTVVTIEGDHFAPGLEVLFGDAPAVDVFFITDRFVNVTSPAGNPGPADVRVVNPDGAEGVAEGAFTYQADLEVHTVEPPVGHPRGGDRVVVTGAGFRPGVLVLVGDRLGLDATVVSKDTIEVTTPPGAVGAADVRVLIEGEEVAMLDDGFGYAAAPRVDAVWPPHGPTIGGNAVELRGRYFTPDMLVHFDDSPAEVVSVSSDGTRATVVAAQGPAGAVDVLTQTSHGEHVGPGAYVRVAGQGDGLEVMGVSPSEGFVLGGDEVLIVAPGLDPQAQVLVLFDGQEAEVLSTTAYPWTLRVRTPPGAAGYVDVQVAQPPFAHTLGGGFRYVPGVAVDAADPEVLPENGGATLIVEGAGFDGEDVEVLVGGVPASGVTILDDGGVAVVSPPCSPGGVDIEVVVDGRSSTLEGAVECASDSLRIFALDPAEAARAGGALVRVLGAGFDVDATVDFGGLGADEVIRLSSGTVSARVPRAEVGALDVTASSQGASATLAGGLDVIDISTKTVATKGPRLERTLNVKIWNSDTGGGLVGATAILGADPETKFQCLTDDRGECTISYDDLAGRVTLTAARLGFSAYTIAGFDARDANIFLRPQSAPGEAGPPGPPGSGEPPPVNVNTLLGRISGQVLGIGKYVQPPPASCAVSGSPDGSQCTPCATDAQCTGSMKCTPLADSGSWCLLPCQSDLDCVGGFQCALTGIAPMCIPHPGTPKARCETTRRSLFGSNPEPGPGADVDPADGLYSIESRLGEVTVYCIAGYESPSGVFVPTWMGTRPTIVVAEGSDIQGIDVTLDIPLRKTLRARVFDLPEHPDGVNSPGFRHGLDIGAEGWIQMPQSPTFVDGEILHFVGYPESLAAFPPDTAYTFYSFASAKVSGAAPQSYRLAYRLETVEGAPLRTRDAETGSWTAVETGMGGDLSGLWGVDEDDLWGVGPRGRLVHRGPLGWSPQPRFTDADLHALHGTAVDAIVAVGDFGTILEFDGATWADGALSSDVQWHLRDVHGDWIVGDQGVLRRDGAVWNVEAVLHADGMRGVTSVGDHAVVVGIGGKILEHVGGTWLETLAGDRVLHAVATDGEQVVCVGEGGVVLTRAWADPAADWTFEEAPTTRDLTSVAIDANGNVYVAGPAGVLLKRDPAGQWTDESLEDPMGLDIQALWAPGQGSPLEPASMDVFAVGRSVLPIGPWMDFPQPISPTWGGFMQPGLLDWDLFDESPEPSHNTVFISSTDGFTVWAVVAHGSLDEVVLPDLPALIDYDPVPSGLKYFNVTRALNPNFSMDGYRYSHLSMWRRTTWSAAFGSFY